MEEVKEMDVIIKAGYSITAEVSYYMSGSTMYTLAGSISATGGKDIVVTIEKITSHTYIIKYNGVDGSFVQLWANRYSIKSIFEHNDAKKEEDSNDRQ